MLAICTSANALLEINVFFLDSTADSAFKNVIYLAGLITIGVGSALMMAMRNFKRQTTVAISSCAIAVPQYFLIFFILISLQGGHSPEHFALFGIFISQALSYLVSLALDFGYKSNVH